MAADPSSISGHVDGPTPDEAQERSYLEAALDCVIVIDGEGRVVEFNPSAERTFGYARSKVLGRLLGDLIVPPALRDLHRQALTRFVATREPRLFGKRLELVAMRSDGTEFPVELSLSRVDGEPLLIYGAVRDLSEEVLLKEELHRLADEQAALREVATLVAKGADTLEVFSAVAGGVAKVLGAPGINMIRFDQDSVATKIAGWGIAPLEVGSHWSLDDPSVMAMVAHTGRPARIEDYAETAGAFATLALGAGIRSGIGAPIIVDGRTWGVVITYWGDSDQASGEAEVRLSRFTELVATAIANMQSLDRLHKLIDEQSALSRVATLVARGASGDDIIAAVCSAVGPLLAARQVRAVAFAESGGYRVLQAWRGDGGTSGRPGAPDADIDLRALSDRITTVRAAYRVVDTSELNGSSGSEVGARVIVQDDIWGALIVESDEILPSSAETSVARFAEMIATALTNELARTQLLQSRVRIVTAADEARRHLQRNIHDGAQQRIVASVIDLQMAEERFDGDPPAARAALRSALETSQAGLEELRELAAGLHPRILSRGGLNAALNSIASRARIPVTVVAPTGRYASHVEAAAYFVVTEGLANVAKHSQATSARVHVRESTSQLLVTVEDDGIGGVDIDGGTGLRGLEDRAEALGGRLVVESIPGRGTSLFVSIPMHA
jgi:PAS domain S-box-containing protein